MTVTLDTISHDASPQSFPRHVLEGCRTGLVMFAAGFHGRQDAVWMVYADMQATCVDTDHEKLAEMMAAYPEGWEYVRGDAFDYALSADRQWDVVTLDPFTNLMIRCAQLLPLWCRLARRAVVLGCSPGMELEAPSGWELTERWPRSANAEWAVLR